MNAAEIHARIDWPEILARLGIPATALRNRHGPCPACGGKDRFRFHNRNRHGDFFCNGCGSGDGFTLLMRVKGWKFAQARQEVLAAAGLAPVSTPIRPAKTVAAKIAQPTLMVSTILHESLDVEKCDDAVRYLQSRRCWPLPEECTLRAHPHVEYWDGDRRLGRYPALVAPVIDINGEIVTIHVTYLSRGRKLALFSPRKLLSKLTGRTGCAVRLMPQGNVLGIGEGIETCLSAAALSGVPVWAATNAHLLGAFEPPPGVTRLIVLADNDPAGLAAASEIQARLSARMEVELRIPDGAKDWNDLMRFGGDARE